VDTGAPVPLRPPRRPRRHFSSLTTRILAVNMVALVILVLGFLYLDRHQRDLFVAKLHALMTQGEVMAGALGETVVKGADEAHPVIDREAAQSLLRRLVVPVGTRARLFDTTGRLLADSALIAGAGSLVETEELPPPEAPGLAERIYDAILKALPPHQHFPPVPESFEENALNIHEVARALKGYKATAIRDAQAAGIVVSAAVPVQQLKQIQGALLLTASAEDIQQSLKETRVAILEAFGIALGITILISLYIGGTIAQPVRRLARAADHVRLGHGRHAAIPDLSRRNDEIGDLSLALREMTEALSARMDAIESFAADVAHEIKNPLSSMRNAVEAANQLSDETQKTKLMAIVLDDVKRLDRLITDISEASRLDAELSRLESEPVDLGRMIEMLAGIEERAAEPRGIRLTVRRGGDQNFVVPGFETRLSQVFRNLIGNAISFSPDGAEIRLELSRHANEVVVTVDDDGPGIPPGKETALFDRFFSLRPAGEKFGLHSGLGLSIAKQIVEAHRGRLLAENRVDEKGCVRGARFTVRLPAS